MSSAPSPGRVALLVPAAGTGVRMGGVRKPFIEVAGRSVLEWALAPFLVRSDVLEVVVATDSPKGWPAPELGDSRVRFVPGGSNRFESVVGAFEGLSIDVDVIVVHDGARPFPPPECIEACIRAAAGGSGAVAGIPAVDTVKRVDEDGVIVDTPPRDRLWYAQTPQAFPAELFDRAVASARAGGLAPTDDAAMVEAVGGTVRLVEASPRNLKITHPADLVIAEAYVAQGLV